MTTPTRITCTLALATTMLIAACGGGDAGTGTLRAALTDAPACGYQHVYVTIDRLRVHKSASAGANDTGWIDLPPPSPQRIDLLTLTNGALFSLGQAPLPAGRYTQLRLVLVPNSPSAPLANSVQPTGGAETALDTPSGAQSGLKIDAVIDVAADQTADVVLDFDAAKSIVRRGSTGGFNLKPVIRATPVTAGPGMRIEGFVSAALDPAATQVSAQLGGVVVKSTPTDGTGKFTLYPVPAGNYDLVVTSDGFATATITGVPVLTATPTTIGSTANRLPAPPASTMHTASGSVAAPGASVDASVAALKTYTAGPTVVAAECQADASNGAFSFALPSGAPLLASHQIDPALLNFAADAAASGVYTLAATSGATVKSRVVDLSGADSTDTLFTFP